MTLRRWNIIHNYGMAFLAIVYISLPIVSMFVVFTAISFLFLWVLRWKDIRHLSPSGGIPNRITLLRFLGIVFIILFSDHFSGIMVTSVLLVLIMLDGLDGFLAKKLHQETEFGRIFDMETDAFFVCTLSCLLYENSLIGKWILLPAFIKYFYAVLMHITGMLDYPEEKTFRGAFIAVIMFLALAVAFVLPLSLRNIVLITATVLIFISFFLSVLSVIKKSKV